MEKVIFYLYILGFSLVVIFFGFYIFFAPENNWLIGHDDGQAYRAYQQQMEQAGYWPDPDGWK